MIYRKLIEEEVYSKYSRVNNTLCDIENKLQAIDIQKTDDLNELYRIEDNLENLARSINAVSLDYNIEELKSRLLKEVDEEVLIVAKIQLDKEKEIVEKIECRMKEKVSQINEENARIRAHNEKVRREIAEHNSVYNELESKRLQLNEYSDEVLKMCRAYGITTSHLIFDSNSFSTETLEMYYDSFLEYMQRREKRSINPARMVREYCKDAYSRLMILVILTVIILTPILDYAGLALFAYILIGQFKQVSTIKTYSIMLGLIYNVRPLEMGILKEVRDSDLENELSTEIDIDSDADFQDILEQAETVIEEDEEETVESKKSTICQDFMNNYQTYIDIIDDTINKFNNYKTKVYNELQGKSTELVEKISQVKSNMDKFGFIYNNTKTFKTKFILGMDEKTMLPEEVDLGLSNLSIKPYKDVELQNLFVKTLIINALCNVAPNAVNIHLFDPNNQSRDFRGFQDKWAKDIIKYHNDSLDAVLKEVSENANLNLSKLKGRDIQEFNTIAEQEGKLSIAYDIVIILSQPKELVEKEALLEFMKYSASAGVFIWVITETVLNGTKVFNKPFEGVSRPIKFDPINFPIEVMRGLEERSQKYKPKGLMWKEYTNLIPNSEHIWHGSAKKYIDLDIGLESGDPARNIPFTVGNDGDIHGLCIGGTGAGKSIFTNNAIINIALKYSPKEVELWLIDFKRVEFSIYLPSKDSPAILPHIKTCLCTTDPEFATSTFQALQKLMKDRYIEMGQVGCKNLIEFNDKMERDGTPERKWTRVLFWVEEFQVVYNRGENKTVELLNNTIASLAKEARAAGIHMIFSSQSMKNTMPADTMAQFTLRLGLRCDKDASEHLMGANTSGSIREKNGWLYVRTMSKVEAEDQPRYKTPYIDTKEIQETVNMLYNKAKEQNILRDDVTTYDETEYEQLDALNNLVDGLKSSNIDYKDTFFLGDRMVYSSNRAPYNVKMTARNNKHIVASFSVLEDQIRFIKTIQKNIQLQPQEYSVIYNSQVEDVHYLAGLDEELKNDELRLKLSYPSYKVSEMVNNLEAILKARKEKKLNTKPLYVVLMGWDKATGFGIDPNYQLVGRLASILDTCGEYHMHLIFVATRAESFPIAILKACGIAIAGKVTETTSTKLLDSRIACKTYTEPDGYMFVSQAGVISRLKMYKVKIDRELESEEFIL